MLHLITKCHQQKYPTGNRKYLNQRTNNKNGGDKRFKVILKLSTPSKSVKKKYTVPLRAPGRSWSQWAKLRIRLLRVPNYRWKQLSFTSMADRSPRRRRWGDKDGASNASACRETAYARVCPKPFSFLQIDQLCLNSSLCGWELSILLEVANRGRI